MTKFDFSSSDKLKKRLNELYCEKRLSAPQISKIERISQTHIYRLMERWGIRRRSISEATIGRPSWWRGKKRPKDFGVKISKSRRTEKSRGITKENLEELYWGLRLSQSEIAKIFNVHQVLIGYYMRKYGIKSRTVSEANKGSKNGMFGKNHLEQTREKMVDAWKTYRKILPEHRIKMLKGCLKKPTNLELRLIKIIQEYNLPFKYVGDGSVIIYGLNPDFINCNGKKQIIETFGRAFHDPLSKKNFVKVAHVRTEDGRKFIFKTLGYDTLIFWDDELKTKTDWEIAEEIKSWMS